MKQSLLDKIVHYKRGLGLCTLTAFILGIGTLGIKNNAQANTAISQPKCATSEEIFDLSDFLSTRTPEQRKKLLESLESITPLDKDDLKKTDEALETKVEDFYIQVGALSQDNKNIPKISNMLKEIGYKVNIQSEKGIKKILAGNYKSLDTAINNAGKILDLIRKFNLDEVGIVGLNKINNNYDWFSIIKYDVGDEEKLKKIPKNINQVRQILFNATRDYNSKFKPKHELDPLLALAVLEEESHYKRKATGYKLKPRWVKGRKGNKKKILVYGTDKHGNKIPTAFGYMQIELKTLEELGIPYKDRYDPRKNIGGGVRYLGNLLQRFGGRADLVIASYNAGPSKVEKLGRAPHLTETKRYMEKVKGTYNRLKIAYAKKTR